MEDVIDFFPHFDAFHLPPPSLEPEVVQNMNEREREVNTSFLRAVQEFQHLVKAMTRFKRNVNGGPITGEGKTNITIFRFDPLRHWSVLICVNVPTFSIVI